MTKPTLEEFVAAVNALRANQRLYFQNKSPTVLRICKEQERQVDAMTKKLLSPQESML